MTSADAAPNPNAPEDIATLHRRRILRVQGLTKHFPLTVGLVFRREVGRVHAVDDVSFTVDEGETLALVGESGCGKSTLARAIVRLVEPTAGRITFLDQDLSSARPKALRRLRKDLQIVFQDPFGSLNPRRSVRQIVSEPLRIHGLPAGAARIDDLLAEVGLTADFADRYPHETSGGQRQRIAIARALATRPKLLVCDELVSALDVSIRGQILNLLVDLQRRLHLAYVLISHDLGVVRDISDRVAVMYLGQIVELCGTADLFSRPMHPYTVALLSAIPVPDPAQERARQRIVLHGEIPSATVPPAACRFHTRCWKATERCRTEPPPLVTAVAAPGHLVACHFPEHAN